MMSGFIVDPTDPDRAIAPSGALAGRVFLVPSIEDPTAPKLAEIQAGRQIGWVDPVTQPIIPDPDLQIRFYYPREDDQ